MKAQTETMKAITHLRYGGVEALAVENMAKPVVGDDEILVRVRTAAVNKGDWHVLTGKPYLIRLAGYGFCQPKNSGFGQELAGSVEAVGQNVQAFQPGDEVFGEIKSGAFAEYVCVGAGEVALKPTELAFEDAAALPSSALTALQGLRDHGQIKSGHKVLINGASGGVGTFAVQLAKFYGAEVTGVCSEANVELVCSLGADHVVDYGATDFTKGRQRYDLIFDIVGNRSLADIRRVLRPDGVYVACAGEGGDWFGPMGRMIRMGLTSSFGGPRMVSYVTKPNPVDLAFVADLVVAGRISPVIGRRCGEIGRAHV